MRQKYFDVPWAFSGDQTTVPDPLQSGGTVSFTEGWNYNYQRNLNSDPLALPIDRSTMNYVLNTITAALQALQQTAIPEWITAANNGGAAFPYQIGAEVLYSAAGTPPFGKYVNLIANNTNTPSAADPTGATTGWQFTADALSSVAQASAGTDNSTIMTPVRVAQQDALRALLAGSSSQVFNVGPAVSATQAPQLQQMVGRLLRTSVYALVSGTQMVSVNGAAFTSAGATTFTALSATTSVDIEGVGGGGAGGGAAATGASTCSCGSGGNCGAYGRGVFTSGFSSLTISVGAGGTGVPGAAGNSGGTSSAGSLFSTPGGAGGNASSAAAPPVLAGPVTPSGTITGGNVIASVGAPGGFGFGFNSATLLGGPGASNIWGGGGAGGGGAPGSSGQTFGAGGGGSVNTFSQSAKAAGNGFGGVIVIREYA